MTVAANMDAMSKHLIAGDMKMSDNYQVITTNLPKVKEALRKEWPEELGYLIMRQLVGTEDNPPKPCCGDAFVIRDALILHGCIWSVDFYIRKMTK